jgi:hypothetical protein
MLDSPLHVPHPPARITLVPGAIEFLRDGTELYDEVAREVLWL